MSSKAVMRLLLSDMPGFDCCCAHWGTKTDGIAIIMILLHNNYADMIADNMILVIKLDAFEYW